VQGGALTKSLKAADHVVVAHSQLSKALQEDGTLRPPLLNSDARNMSEATFRAWLLPANGLKPSGCTFKTEEVATLSGLSTDVIKALALFDVLRPSQNLFAFSDLAIARRVSRWRASGLTLVQIVEALHQCLLMGQTVESADFRMLLTGVVGVNVSGETTRLDGQFELELPEMCITADAVFEKAEHAEQEADWTEASRLYEIAFRLDPADAVIPYNLGNVLTELGDHRRAEIAYQRALVLDPGFAEAWYNLGLLNEARGQTDRAISSYKTALLHEAEFHYASFNLARILSAHGNHAEALPLWEGLARSEDFGDRAIARKWATLSRLELMRSA
jgi:tetratricopeptide (TPR) repeat protein